MGVTTGSLKLANVWKVIREFDLDEIRSLSSIIHATT
jgi:hypothetical protein